MEKKDGKKLSWAYCLGGLSYRAFPAPFLGLSEKIVKNISKNFLLYYFSLKCEVFEKTGNLKVADLNQGTNVEQIVLLPNNGKGMLIIQWRIFLREVRMSWHSSNFPPKRSSVAIGSDLLQDGNDVIAECLELEGQGFESPFKQFFRSRMSLFQISIEKKI